MFTNNKGGIGKTMLAFNCAVFFAQKGYKTVLVDLNSSLIDEVKILKEY